MIDYQAPIAAADSSASSNPAAKPGESAAPSATAANPRSKPDGLIRHSESAEAAEAAVVPELTRLVDWLARMPAATGDAERIDRIAVLEQLRGAVAAAQARETVAFAASQVASQAAAGVPAARRGRGIAEQVGLARRMSPASAARQITLAEAWQLDLPAVFDALRRGETTEWSATLVARETNGLDRHTRRRIAEDLAPELPSWSPREVEAAARRMAYEADPEAILGRGRTARADRRVSLRPAPDTMAMLSAFLPAEQGVATWANLDRHARTLRATGDRRTLGQLMADTLVERVTGQAAAAAIPVEIGITMTADSLLSPDTSQTPAELDGYGPIPTDLALDLAAQAGERIETATPERRPPTTPELCPPATPKLHLPATPRLHPPTTPKLGPPATGELDSPGAPSAEDSLAAPSAEDVQVAVWVRRLFTRIRSTRRWCTSTPSGDDSMVGLPGSSSIATACAAICSVRRRSGTSTTSTRIATAGPQQPENGAGLCERANYVKDMPGWSRSVDIGWRSTEDGHAPNVEHAPDGGHASNDAHRPNDGHAPNDEHASNDGHARDDGHTPRIGRTQRIEVKTPTGHRYTSKPPPALGPGGNYRERRRRTALRRLAYLELERLIASLPSPAATSESDGRASEPP